MGDCLSKPKANSNSDLGQSSLESGLGKKQASRDGLDPHPKEPVQHAETENFIIGVFPDQPPEYSKTPRPTAWDLIPKGVQAILSLWKRAATLDFFGHKGAWNASRHGQIWLDSAYSLRPITITAIFLYAAMRMLVAQALKGNMTFYFTTFPNVESDELSDKDREVLQALIKVFNANTYRKASALIDLRKAILAGEGMMEFIDNPSNFVEGDTQEQKLVKLLAHTRGRMKQYWYGWKGRDLNFKSLKSLYRKARKASEEQPMLLNNTSFIYQMTLDSYKRQLKSANVYPLTCTFILGTPLQPQEVEAIQNCQTEGKEVLKDAREVMKAKALSSMFKKTIQPDPGSTEVPVSVAEELDKQGHQFCIQAVVFADHLSVQAKDGYSKVDTFLDGQPDDINDVTFLSEVRFLIYFLHEYWIFKTTTSHDPRVDSWPELRNQSPYNKERVAPEDGKILLPSPELIRRWVFDIVDEEDEDVDEEDPKIRQQLVDDANRITV
jgi:hypothetical protein